MGRNAIGTSSAKLRNPRRFVTLLSSAACEWFLIFMLFVEAALSYLLTEFARYCDLQTPCPLCSRIEHAFGKDKHGYYTSLLCCNHREEISSFVYCHIHSKLADVQAMCEDCLMSLSRRLKSDSESRQLFVAKLGVDNEESNFKSLLLSKSFVPDSSGSKTCSCCHRLLRAKKSNAQRMLQVTPVGYGASKANVKPPLPRVPGCSRFSRRNSLKRLRDKFSGPMPRRPGGSTGVDPLSHVGYTELNITSDTESEFLFSDEENATSAFGNYDSSTESNVQQVSQKLPKALGDNSSPGNQNLQTSEPLASLLDKTAQLQSSEANSVSHLGASAFVKNDLEQLNWTQPNSSPGLPELISLDDVPQAAESYKSSSSFPQPSNLPVLSELLSLNTVLSSSNVVKISEKSVDATGTSETGKIMVTKHTAGEGFTDVSDPSVANNVNSINTLAITERERMESGLPAKRLTNNNYERVEEKVKLSLQVSSSKMDLSPKDMSPRVHGHHDRIQRTDTSGSDAIDMVQMAAALERYDSGHESSDGISVKDIEGESHLDKLKRQVVYDRKCMKALFKELEEERNAAAISANQAMAMITRLQEEKAALHMEALQYLRMMEEQAEYDMEALEKANDLLAEREKEIQDLEAELEIYRNNILDEPLVAEVESMTVDHCSMPYVEDGPIATDDSKSSSILNDRYKPKQSSSTVLGFEDEKLYISRCLEKLEKKFEKVSRNGVLMHLANVEYAEHMSKEVNDGEELSHDTQTQIKHQKGETVLLLQKDFPASNASLGKDGSADSFQESHHLNDESSHLDIGQKLSSHGGERELDIYKSEIIDLRDRLEALETDRDILNHALNSLHSENDGLQFIQEIAHQLQELRKIEFK